MVEKRDQPDYKISIKRDEYQKYIPQPKDFKLTYGNRAWHENFQAEINDKVDENIDLVKLMDSNNKLSGRSHAH